jgi:hypothetical protein
MSYFFMTNACMAPNEDTNSDLREAESKKRIHIGNVKTANSPWPRTLHDFIAKMIPNSDIKKTRDYQNANQRQEGTLVLWFMEGRYASKAYTPWPRILHYFVAQIIPISDLNKDQENSRMRSTSGEH